MPGCFGTHFASKYECNGDSGLYIGNFPYDLGQVLVVCGLGASGLM